MDLVVEFIDFGWVLKRLMGEVIVMEVLGLFIVIFSSDH